MAELTFYTLLPAVPVLAAWTLIDVYRIAVSVADGVRPLVYDYDVRSLAGLQGLAAEFGVAIIVVHHTRKALQGTLPVWPVRAVSGLELRAARLWLPRRSGRAENGFDFDVESGRLRLGI